jgi:Bacterial regulatory proteins, tetR family
MKARKTKKQVVSEFRTNEILEAARKIFAEKGYYAAKVESIAEAAAFPKERFTFTIVPKAKSIYPRYNTVLRPFTRKSTKNWTAWIP